MQKHKEKLLIITKPYLFHKGEIQVVRSTNAQVQNIHTSRYRVVKCIQEPWGVGYLHWEQDDILKILPACTLIRIVLCKFVKKKYVHTWYYNFTMFNKKCICWISFVPQLLKIAYSAKSSTWASVNTRKAYISVSGANPGHSASWPAITPATNVPCPRLSFSVSSFVQFVRSYKISLLSNVFILLDENKNSWEMWSQDNTVEFKFECLIMQKVRIYFAMRELYMELTPINYSQISNTSNHLTWINATDKALQCKKNAK